ncbi:MAG: SPOR domain-containing protein [Bacteroidales bacterium]
MTLHKLITCILVLTVSHVVAISAQQSAAPGTEKSPEQQYEEFISAALKHQVRADSLARTANKFRRDLAFLNDDSRKREMENRVLSLENESFSTQKEADSLYTLARAIELRIMASQREGAGNAMLSSPAFETSSRRGSGNHGIQTGPDFLVLGEKNISQGLSSGDLAKARDLESRNVRANELMEEVALINDEIEQLGFVLDSNPRRRERRKINQRIEELSAQSFDKKMEAMIIYKDVNAIRYAAATGFLDQRRSQLRDSLVIKAGLVHEEYARESFTQAGGLRETAVDLRSDKYLEGFILRAYTEELKAFKEMEKALEIYDSPVTRGQRQADQVPVNANGRIDAGLALARSRSAVRETSGANRPADNHASENRHANAHPVENRAAESRPVENIPAESPHALETPSEGIAQHVNFGFSSGQSPNSNRNPVPLNVTLPDGMVFTIQLGVFNTLMNPSSFGGLDPVFAERINGTNSIRYFAGVFGSVPEAEKALLEVNRRGFSDAFLVAFNDNLKIPVTRARQMERGRQAANEANIRQDAVPVSGQPAPASDPVKTVNTVVFKIQLGAFSDLLPPDIHSDWNNMASGKNLEYTRNNNGLYVYTLGNFNTFDEAVKVRDHVRKTGVPDAFIVPYKDGVRIRMEEANELLNIQ